MSSEKQILVLEDFDTPTISNAIATFPASTDKCLGLYNPWTTNWYTDQTLHCMFPDLGPRVGYAVTVVYGMPDPAFKRLGFVDILKAIEKAPKPVVLTIKQNFPDHIKNKNGLLGGNMLTAYKSMGVSAVLTDGPSRDLGEIKPLGIQCMFTGLSASHGNFDIEAINVPVNICGMDVAPNDIIHMDENGAIKFPEMYVQDIKGMCEKIVKDDEMKQAAIAKTNDPVKISNIMKGKLDI